MRHRNKVNNLSRTSSHRSAMLSNMTASLILHKRITTTVAKAKALRKYAEPIINRSKDDSTHSRRTVFSMLQNKFAVTELFREISQKVADRPGGYTRIIKLGTRLGDNAEMCMIELVDYNENLLKTDKGTKKAKTTRRRSSKKSSAKPESVPSNAVKTEESAKVNEAVDQPLSESATDSEKPVDSSSEEETK
jgi:large subunit ribosomal protein L17